MREFNWDSMPVDFLDISTRAYGCLINIGATTCGKIDCMTDHELLAVPNFGANCLREVRKATDAARKRLHRRGYSL